MKEEGFSMENLIIFYMFYILYSIFMYMIAYEGGVNSVIDIIGLLTGYVILTMGQLAFLFDVTIA